MRFSNYSVNDKVSNFKMFVGFVNALLLVSFEYQWDS